MLTEFEQVMSTVTKIFDQLEIQYMIGGSIASSVHGAFRLTNDIDFVADISRDKVEDLTSSLNEFYVDDEVIREALDTQSSFSMIHLKFITKVDVFIKAKDKWTEGVWRRRKLMPISADGSFSAYVSSAEDTILQKLVWFRIGNEVSDKQWSDILGMLQMQRDRLDTEYMHSSAELLRLEKLLERAFDAASS